MKILFVADGRSPTALSWIDYFIQQDHAVHLASTFPCQAIDGLASLVTIPVALSGLYGQAQGGEPARFTWLRRLLPVRIRTLFRQIIAPSSFRAAARQLHQVIESLQPDIVHAMRIPYEGMVASMALAGSDGRKSNPSQPPLLVSVWGNDFTLHARATPSMAQFTQQTLQAAGGLHTDCQRDQRLAFQLGFSRQKPAIVLPGGGGIHLATFYPPDIESAGEATQPTEELRSITIINPRGFRAYVRNDTFFHAIPMVIERYPHVRFVCPGMLGEAQAEKWCDQLKVGNKVELLPAQTRQQMAELFRQSQITISVTTHDGTPNTLLEAMACGSFPILGDIESIREWITPGVNGLLVDPSDPQALAEAILSAIAQPELLSQAREQNLRLVRERADYSKVMRQAEEFYRLIIGAA